MILRHARVHKVRDGSHLGPKSYLDKKTEYIDGIVIRHP